MKRNGNNKIKLIHKIGLRQVLAIDSSQELAQFGLLLVLERMQDVLHAALLHKLVQRHYATDRQAPPQALVKGILPMKMVIGTGHLKQALTADVLFALDKTAVTPAAIARVNQRKKILQNGVAC